MRKISTAPSFQKFDTNFKILPYEARLVTGHMENDQFYQEIWKYTPSNELVAKIGPIFMNFHTDAIIIEKWLVLDGEGNVYRLITEKEGVKIIKWSRK